MSTSTDMNLTGPAMNDLVDRLVEWYNTNLLRLMEALERGGTPYKSRHLTQTEQLSRFLEAQVPDYESIVMKLNMRYQGQPNAYDLVNRDLAEWLRHMIGLMMTGQAPEEAAYATAPY